MRPGRRNGKSQTNRESVDSETISPKVYEFQTLSRPKNATTSVQSKLEDLRQQKRRLITRKAEAGASWQNSQARLKHVQAEIEGVPADILSCSEERDLLERESEPTSAQELRQELTELIAEQRIIEKALGATKRLKDKCPTCGQAVSPGIKAKESEKQSGRLAEIQGRVQGLRAQLSECTDLEVRKSRLED
jgi:DNA repair exonuclease SbcCD ATPase subunit